MGKKVKPNKLLDEQLNQSNSSNDIESVESTSIAIDSQDNASIVGNRRMTNDQKDKLEQYDALEKTIEGLLKEKEQLSNKVIEYTEKIASLKDLASKSESLMAKVDKLSKQLAKAQEDAKNAISLQKECKSLREEVDNYLIKISELTFQNANLTCQMQELNQKLSQKGTVPNQNSFGPRNGIQQSNGGLARARTDAYNPYFNNGYGSW